MNLNSFLKPGWQQPRLDCYTGFPAIAFAACALTVVCQLTISPAYASNANTNSNSDGLAAQILQHLGGGGDQTVAGAEQHRTEMQFAELSYSYLQKNMFEEASSTLDGALLLYPESADLLSIKAETLAMLNEGSMQGEPFLLVQKALDINSGHRHGLWLAAVANRQSGNYEASYLLLEKLKTRYSTESDSYEMVTETQSLLEQELGPEFVAKAKYESSAKAPLPVTAAIDANAPKSLHIAIDISESARSKFTDNAVVFVYAKSTEQSRMPLAVAKTNVGSLPATIVLDDSMSMMPDISLNDAKSVTVGARVSREGTALAFSGDWQDEAHGIELKGKVETSLFINTLIQ